MAVSKNTRKKSKKRTQNHSAPVNTAEKLKREQEAEAQRRETKKHLWQSIAAPILMLVGVLIAYIFGIRIGYPISFAGGLWGMYAAHFQEKGKRMTMVCYGAYCVLVAYQWFAVLLGR